VGIATVFAHISCRDIEASEAWYTKLFGRPPTRRPGPDLVEWQFTDSAEVSLCRQSEHAGHGTLTLGVLPLEPECSRLEAAGLAPGPIEETEGYFAMRMRDPDRNLIVFASARRA